MALAQRRATSGEQAGETPLLRRAGVLLALLLAGGMILGAMFLPVLQNSDATSTGYQIEHAQQQLDDLRAKTYTLQAQIADLGSETRIRQEAARLGMVPAGRASAVTVNVPAPAGVFLPHGLAPTLTAVAGAAESSVAAPPTPADQSYPPAGAPSATPAPTAVPTIVPPGPVPSVGPPP
ncbi:MAG TPA: hypothetical protein VKV26_02850 [Dehalococcoidia bacterium]|nr:hypothetical protein [Dehalococcoidia bacterium]